MDRSRRSLNEVCPKDVKANGETPLDQPAILVVGDKPTGVDRSERRPKIEVEKVRAFLRKVGRPKVYPDRKTQMREVMRRKRERDRAKG